MSEYIVELTDENHIRLMAECDGIHERIVRCRDCEYLGCYKPFDAKTGKPSEKVTIYICNGQFWNVDGTSEVEPDGYCAWGERRSE